MNIFRIKHVPTGLYYGPANTTGNLGKVGKIYHRKQPYPTYITIRFKSSRGVISKENQRLVDYFNLDVSKIKKGQWFSFREHIKTDDSQWEFEPIKTE